MPITKVGSTIVETAPTQGARADRTDVHEAGAFAICDNNDVLKQIQFDPSGLPTNTQLVLKAGTGGAVVTFPSTSGTLAVAGPATSSFTAWQPTTGTAPTAVTPADTMTLTSSDGSIVITGNSSTDTLDFKIGTVPAPDLPTPTPTTLGGVKSLAAVTHNWINSISTAGQPVASQPAFTDISGTASAAQLPNPTSSTLGGVQSLAAVTSNWINTISTSGVPSATQPAFSDISGTATSGQLPSASSAAPGIISALNYQNFDNQPTFVADFYEDFIAPSPFNYTLSLASANIAYTANPATGVQDNTTCGVGKLSMNNSAAAIAIYSSGQAYGFGQGAASVEWRVYLSALSNSTDRYTLRVGWGDNYSTSADTVDGVYFEYSDNINSGNWAIKAANNSTRTTNNTTTAVVAGSWLRLRIDVNAAGNVATFSVNGTTTATVSTVTTNIPTTRLSSVWSQIAKSVSGNAATPIYYTDYCWARFNPTTPR